MEKLEEYGRIEKYYQAMEQDKELVKKLRDRRIQVKKSLKLC
jgi:hypothetical protein